MKRIFTFAVAIFVLSLLGCGGFKVVVQDNPFKKSTVITADMWHKVIDSKIDNQQVLYQKEITEGKVSNPIVSFKFVAQVSMFMGYNYSGEPLGNEVFILCDNRSFKVDLSDNSRVQQAITGTSQSTSSTGQTSTQAYTANFCNLMGKITLTPDIQKGILDCESYKLRFTVGTNNLTLEATPSQLKTVKEFLTTSKVVKK